MLAIGLSTAGFSSTAGEPALPNWGGSAKQFSWSAVVNITDLAEQPADRSKWSFVYSYDWSLKASRYDHGAGQHDEVCLLVKTHQGGEPCTVLNAADEQTYISWPTSGDCCRCHAKWAPFTIRPDWLAGSSATYQGPTTVAGQTVDEWLSYGASDNHYYASTDPLQAPIRFMEHKNGKLKQWDFSQWNPAAPASSTFSPPAGCGNICPSTACGGSEL